MKLGIEQRNLAITLALCGAVVAYVFLLFLPTQKSIAALQAELATHQDYIARQQQSHMALAGLKADVQAARVFSENWRATAPSANRLAPVNASISLCAKEAQVEITQINPQPLSPLSQLVKAPVSISCDGSFEQVFNFISRIESLPYTTWIEQMHLTKLDGGGDSVRCELKLVIFADKRDSSG